MERHIGPANPDRNAKGARCAAEGDPRLIRPDMLYLFQRDRRQPLRSGDNNYWNHTPMTNLQNVPRETHVCPLCGATIRQLEFDPWNRWHCDQAACWFHANPVPADVAQALGKLGADVAWAADNGFWLGFLSAGGLIAAIAGVVWCLR